MPGNQQNQPESGSRTLTQTAVPARNTDQNGNNGEPSEPVGVLKLRGGPSRRQRVVWSEGTVDNEGMGKKKSKICCIYHKPKAYDESSDESDSDCDHEHHPKPATKSRRKDVGEDAVAESSESEGGGGDGKAKRSKKAQKPDKGKDGSKDAKSDRPAKVNRYDHQGPGTA